MKPPTVLDHSPVCQPVGSRHRMTWCMRSLATTALPTRENVPGPRRAEMSPGPLWVKMRNTHPEQMFSALLPNSDIDRCGRHVSNCQ